MSAPVVIAMVISNLLLGFISKAAPQMNIFFVGYPVYIFKARGKGQIARSRELISMAGIAGTVLMFYFAGNTFLKNMSALTGKLLGLQYGKDPVAVMKIASYEMLWILMPFLGITATFAVQLWIISMKDGDLSVL